MLNRWVLSRDRKTTTEEYRYPSVSLTAENVRLGNKYFLTSTSTSGPSTSTWHASTGTSTSTPKLCLSTDQVPVSSTTRLIPIR